MTKPTPFANVELNDAARSRSRAAVPPSSTSPYLTAAEAAEYVRKTYKAFDHLVRREGIPFVRIGRHRRFTRAQLDRVMRTMALR
jgi:excisionase family DNA binding protein